MMELRFATPENPDFHALTTALDAYYFTLVGDVEKRYAKYNLPHLFDCRVVAYIDGVPAGCGAWKRIDEQTFEVKRIYIDPAYRRKGVASAIITALKALYPDAQCSLDYGKDYELLFSVRLAAQ